MKAGTLEIELLTNVAKLQQDMEKVKKSVAGMTDEVGRRTKAANDNLGGFAGGIGKAGQASRLAGHHVQNLSFQLQDVAVGLASGQRPMTVLMQQGMQIGAIMQQAGLGVGGFAKEVGRMAARFAPAAIAIGGAALMLKLYTDEIENRAGTDEFIRSLGLTADEMKKLEGTTVSMGDTLLGTWDVIAGGLWDKIGPAVTGTKQSFEDWFWESDKRGRESVNNLIAYFVGGFNAIKATWGVLPDVMSDLFIQAVNAGIRAINSLTRASVEGLNWLISQSNKIPGMELAKLSAGQIAEIENSNAGAAKKVGDIWRTEIEKARKDYMGTLGGAVSDAAIERRNSRLRDQAKALIEDRPESRAKPKTDARAEALEREIRATEELIDGLYKLADAYALSEAAALKEQVVSKATAEAIRKQADIASYVAQQMRLMLAQRTADAAKDAANLGSETIARARLNDQIAAGLMTAEEAEAVLRNEAQLRPYLTALAIAEGEAKDKLADVIERLRGEQKKANDEARRSTQLKMLDRQAREMHLLEGQIRLTEELGARRIAALKGLRGNALEDELARINVERQKAMIRLRAEAEAADLLKQGLDAAAAAVLRQAEAEGKLLDLDFKFDKEAAAAQRLADEVNKLIDALTGLGGVGSVVGGMLGLLSGNSDAIGGPLGAIFNAPVSRRGPDGEQVITKLGDEFGKIFDLNGKFAKTMKDVLQGAGNGLLVGSAFFGDNFNQARQIGSAIGGALGTAAGTAIGGPVGAAIGNAVGAILGGFVGGLFGGGTARANMTGAGDVSLGGKNSGSYGVAGDLANSVMAGLQDIADVFGGSIGSFNTTIGLRGDDYRVNPNGTSLKKKKGGVDFGDDAEAAIAYAIADAIRDGAIVGIRETTKRLIEGGTDIQRQLQKALQFESVFKELKEAIDPFGFAMDELTGRFEQLGKLFEEAGATAEEYAQLEQLFQIRRQEAIDEANRKAVEAVRERRDLEIQVLDLLGRKQDALTASRELELFGLKESLKPLQQWIYQLQDANSVIAQFQPLADDLRAYKRELLGGQGVAASLAATEARFRSTAELAAQGDAGAIGGLRADASAFLEAAKANASSAVEYQEALGRVLGAVDDGIFAADTQVDYAQLQIDAINNSANILVEMKDQLAAQQEKIAQSSEQLLNLFKRFEGEGLPVRSEEDLPVYIRTPTDQPLQVEVVS